MSFTINDAFVQQFTGNVRFLAQQNNSRFRPTIIEDVMQGEAMYMEQVAPTAARKKQARHGDSPIMNTQHLRRRVTPYDYEWGDMIDQMDKVRLLIDPASTYAMNAGMALNRGIDDEIIGAFFATAYTGHAGGTAITWPNGNSESVPTQPAGAQIAVNDWTYGNGSGNAGLTISKLISAKMALLAGEGDENEDSFIAVSSIQLGNLLATTEATSTDYNTVAALVEGKISKFMGFNFIHSERLVKNGSSQWRVPAWRRSAMGLGVAKDIETRVAERADKSFSYYAYAMMSVGATRLEEVKLAEIICA